MKKILSIVIFILFATVTVVADTIDVSALLVQNADNIDMVDDMGDNSLLKNFGISVLSSMVAAIITLFLFFRLFRPRVIIAPTIAYFKEKNKEQKFQILIRNRGIFEINDVKICMEGTFDLPNGDIESFSIIEDPIHILSLKGIFHDSNLNEACYTFSMPSKDARMPKKLTLKVLSQHSVSSIVAGKRFEFTQINYKKGSYEKGLFIPEGLNYKNVLFRNGIFNLKRSSFVLVVLLLFESIALFASQIFSNGVNMLIIIGSFFMILLILILWLLLVYAKGNAYNKGYITHNLKIIMASFKNNQSTSSSDAEEVPYEEIKHDDAKSIE